MDQWIASCEEQDCNDSSTARYYRNITRILSIEGKEKTLTSLVVVGVHKACECLGANSEKIVCLPYSVQKVTFPLNRI